MSSGPDANLPEVMNSEPIRRRHRLITRPMIVDTARRLFREEGYRGTTLEMVATELGVTRAALYHWVENQESLLFGMCNSLYHWYQPDGRIRPRELADEVLEMVFGGLRPR